MKKSVLVISILLLAAVVAGVYLFYTNSSNAGNVENPNQISEEQTPGSAADETSSSETANSPASYDIQIKGFAFSQNALAIKIGDSVTWTNADSASHTITSDSGNELSSGTLAGSGSGGYYSSQSAGGSYSHTFNQAGTFAYHCGFHSSMKATIIVE